MVPEEYYEDEYYDDEYDEEIDGEEDHFIPAWLRETPYWAVSALLHVVLFAILLVIFTDPPSIKEDQVPINIKPIPKKEDKYDPTVKRDMKKTKKIVDRKLGGFKISFLLKALAFSIIGIIFVLIVVIVRKINQSAKGDLY